ncbi:hypothetical protein GQX73_g6595 [Xylaria multiplex]|uniref:Uncharacterized protein n=1 Tax=Xylaria multiplex TaxID=323545 RepID=A0A7C8ILY3_9PEZI|nr:hypothetical protein GQX73_g6595 [Xylaria multiplex]
MYSAQANGAEGATINPATINPAALNPGFVSLACTPSLLVHRHSRATAATITIATTRQTSHVAFIIPPFLPSFLDQQRGDGRRDNARSTAIGIDGGFSAAID